MTKSLLHRVMMSINNEFNREDKQRKLFKLYRLMLALMLAAALSGCATSNITARHTYNSQTDFSGLNSYAWVQGKQAVFSTSESAEHYKGVMENMLATKGFKPSSQRREIRTGRSHGEEKIAIEACIGTDDTACNFVQNSAMPLQALWCRFLENQNQKIEQS